MDRIEAEMTAIAKKEGFADLASFRASLKPIQVHPEIRGTDPRRLPPIHCADGAETAPTVYAASKSPVTVEAIPAFRPRPRLITSRARRTANALDAWLSPHPTSPSARSSTTRQSPITKAFPDITCSCRFSNSSRDCLNSGSTGSASMLHRGLGFVRGATRQEVGFYNDPFQTTAACRRSCFAPCGWWSTPASTQKDGRRTSG